MTNLEKMAQLFNSRNNPEAIGITTGKVVSTNPLKISWGDSVVLDNDKLIVANLLKNGFSVDYLDDNGTSTTTRTLTIRNSLQQGDTVIMIPDSNYKLWYVIDKV